MAIPSIPVEPNSDWEALAARCSSPSIDRVAGIERQISTYETAISTRKRYIMGHRKEIRALQDEDHEKSARLVEKANQLKEMESQRKELLSQIRNVKDAKYTLSQESRTIKDSMALKLDQQSRLECEVEELNDQLLRGQKQLTMAKQQIELEAEFPDETLRLLAMKVRGIHGCEDENEGELVAEPSSDDDYDNGSEAEGVTTWRSLDIGDATVDDLRKLNDILAAGEGQNDGRRSITISVSGKGDTSATVDESKSGMLDNVSSSDHQNQQQNSKGANELSACQLHIHLDAIADNAAQVAKYMAALRGAKNKRRALEQKSIDDDTSDCDASIASAASDHRPIKKRRVFGATRQCTKENDSE